VTVTIITGETCFDAWHAGAEALTASRSKELSNMVTVIADPCRFDPDWHRNSPHHFSRNGNRLTDVINTIFPLTLWRRYPNRSNFYEAYLIRYARAKGMRGVSWGTYFQRLIASPPEGTNQLERAISKLGNWRQRSTTAFVFHLATPADGPRPRGGPCWQFAEILWNSDGTLDLTVVYRNHDFYNKVLGNYVGLGQLLSFIAHESGKQPGRLVCHSVHAFFDTTQNVMTSTMNA
jgi:thymidylate synthase